MVIAGAGGLGIEVLYILMEENYPDEICFFDENAGITTKLFDKYKVITDFELLEKYFTENENAFVTAVGNPRLRKKLSEKILKAGGKFKSVISSKASYFRYNKPFEGGIVQPGVGISHGVEIGISAAIHINSTIGHSTKIGNYVNIGPGANIIGPVSIGDFSYIGAQSLIMPDISIGKNVIIAAGSYVDKDIPDFGEWNKK